QNGKRLTARWVEKIVEKHLKKAGLHNMGLSPHKLRHTAATIMYQHGNVDIRVLKEILGHENLGTTQIYTHVSSKQMEDASKNTPLSKIRPK
ncbi:MAG: tyrosine recombinase XerC, partial [Oscillospiraceae bacterium]|nr:tyrosine recombinase XerC [Oscillospiraceae bacterium]